MVTTLRRCVVDEAGATAAEGRWRAVVDAQRDDLALLRARWPDRTSPESLGALARLRRRAVPGGEADEAIGALYGAYGGAARVPPALRRRLERYAREQLGGRPWPERRPSESTEEPSVIRERQRGER
jgi:hypothetical protein